MKRRFLAAAAGLAAAVAGCSSPPAALGNHDAKVMINGKATNALQPVTCYQTGAAWTIETVDKEPGFTATIKLGDTVTAPTWSISAIWATSPAPSGTTTLARPRPRCPTASSTSAVRPRTRSADKPNQSTTATFDITTNC